MNALVRVVLGCCLSVMAWGQGADSCDCGKPDDVATAGSYKVKGIYILKSKGEGVKEHLIQGSFKGTAYVSARAGRIDPSAEHIVTIDGMASVDTFAGSAFRPEPRAGQLEGALAKSPALLYLKGEDMTFRISITHLDCSSVSGVIVLDEETPKELREVVEAEGLSVLDHVGTFQGTLDQNTDQAAKAVEVEQRCGTTDISNEDRSRASMFFGLDAAEALNAKDPFENCLQQRMFRAVGCMLTRRAQWLIARFIEVRVLGDGPMERMRIRRVIGAVKAAELLGCDLGDAMAPIAQHFGQRALDAARRGAKAADLADLAAAAEGFGFEGTHGEGLLEALNVAAQTAGQPRPFTVR